MANCILCCHQCEITILLSRNQNPTVLFLLYAEWLFFVCAQSYWIDALATKGKAFVLYDTALITTGVLQAQGCAFWNAYVTVRVV
jgi:type IV secretory pathway VirB6-like protein